MFVRTESLRSYIRLYPVNAAILLICIVLFMLMTVNGGSTNIETLLRFGAFVSPFPPSELFAYLGLWEGVWNYGRYVSAIFLHIGFAHLLFNGFSIFVFAPELERLFGHVQYAVFFLVTGICGNLATHLVDSLSSAEFAPSVGAGASGAIFGVFGAYLALVVLRKAYIDRGTYTTVMTLVIMGAVYSFIVPNVNMVAHFGGLAAGFVWMAVLLNKKRKSGN